MYGIKLYFGIEIYPVTDFYIAISEKYKYDVYSF
jgi:hypothetical protein